MNFTDEELKLISRALNFYSEHPEYMPESRLGDVKAAEQLEIRIYRENFRVGGDHDA